MGATWWTALLKGISQQVGPSLLKHSRAPAWGNHIAKVPPPAEPRSFEAVQGGGLWPWLTSQGVGLSQSSLSRQVPIWSRLHKDPKGSSGLHFHAPLFPLKMYSGRAEALVSVDTVDLCLLSQFLKCTLLCNKGFVCMITQFSRTAVLFLK